MAGLQVSVELNTRELDRPREFLTASAVAEIARALEECGFGACHVTEHPAPDRRFLEAGGHHAVDPLVALSFAAAATTRLRLLTYLFVLPYRNPLLAWRGLSTLDALSEGRLIVGVGGGYVPSEFEALGVDFAERNDLFDEALEVLTRAWQEEFVSYRGRHFSATEFSALPRPVSGPPPIWVGGNTERAMRRAVAYGAGWAPFNNGRTTAARTASIGSLDDLSTKVNRLHEIARAEGRTDPLEVCFLAEPSTPPDFDAGAERTKLAALAEVGVSWLPLRFRVDNRATMLAAIRRYGQDVLARTVY